MLAAGRRCCHRRGTLRDASRPQGVVERARAARSPRSIFQTRELVIGSRLAEASRFTRGCPIGEVHMKTKVWLVRAASLAVVGSLVTPAVAAKPAKRPHPKKA